MSVGPQPRFRGKACLAIRSVPKGRGKVNKDEIWLPGGRGAWEIHGRQIRRSSVQISIFGREPRLAKIAHDVNASRQMYVARAGDLVQVVPRAKEAAQGKRTNDLGILFQLGVMCNCL